MTLTIEISPTLEEPLKLAALEAGLKPEDFARKLIETLPSYIESIRESGTTEHLKTPTNEHESDLKGNSIRTVTEYKRDLISPDSERPTVTAKRAAAVAFLKCKLENDATEDPDEIRFSELKFEELMTNLNSNRDSTGERRVFA